MDNPYTLRLHLAIVNNSEDLDISIISTNFDYRAYVGGAGLDPAHMKDSRIKPGGKLIWPLEVYWYADYYKYSTEIAITAKDSLGNIYIFNTDPILENPASSLLVTCNSVRLDTLTTKANCTQTKLTNQQILDKYDISYPSGIDTGTLECTFSIQVPNTRCWMKDIADSVSLNELTIPGTHDSGTLTVPWGTGWIARTQSMPIKEQLEAGVRAFDIRVCYTYTAGLHGELIRELRIYHGIAPTQLLYSDVIKDFQSFLSENPNECIVMLCNQENSNSSHFDEMIQKENLQLGLNLVDWPDTGVRNPAVRFPRLKDVRGSVVMLRRYPGHNGIDLTDWPDDNKSVFEGYMRNDSFYVQDYYQLGTQIPQPENADPTDIAKWIQEVAYEKFDKMKNAFSKLNQNTPAQIWLLNFSNIAAAPSNHDYIEAYSNAVNPLLHDHIVNCTTKNRFGTVFLDFPTKDLLRWLITTNFAPTTKG